MKVNTFENGKLIKSEDVPNPPPPVKSDLEIRIEALETAVAAIQAKP
jgi:hypothetical protein